LTLSGIAEDSGADGPERIAFISASGELLMVKVGDTLAQRYKVTAISSDVVELTNVNDGTVRRLALR
jgi:Tfp pilus assembly protein PilP